MPSKKPRIRVRDVARVYYRCWGCNRPLEKPTTMPRPLCWKCVDEPDRLLDGTPLGEIEGDRDPKEQTSP